MDQIKKKLTLLSISIFLISIISLLKYSAVDNSLTKEDLIYIPFFCNGIKYSCEGRTYDEELDLIKTIQNCVLISSTIKKPIPLGQEREPKDLFRSNLGYCYDHTRVIEKTLRYSGFKTRHIFAFVKRKRYSIFEIFSRNLTSHALTEVLTKKGWLIVDSNIPWLSLDKVNNPISIKEIKKKNEEHESISWKMSPPPELLLQDFTYIYGFYSRHGQFYPPYNSIPDINYTEFIQNFLSTSTN